MRINYLLLDVFTTERMKGNPLAVVTKADGLLDNEMQAIAAEFNLSETVFLHRPENERNAASVRIFTPRVELPFAGHPTVGASVVLGLQRQSSMVRIEEKVGVILAMVERYNKKSGNAKFGLPRLPEEVGRAPDATAIARALGLGADEIGCGLYKPAVFSAGNLFYLVPVRNADALRRIETNRMDWEEVFPLGRHSVYTFTETPDEAGNAFAARMFSPGMGLSEDPGTGSAAAALVGLIARHAVFATGQAEYAIRQGVEMGRPCRIMIQFRKENDALTYASVGGDAVIIGEGEMEVRD
jgi:trans-2,3-dihydro-3-hydroxyanthranilate isomerase